MSDNVNKTKAQRAAERAEILENMEEEEKEVYRKRKRYVGVQREWKNFFQNMEAEEARNLLLAIIAYDETGEIPESLDKTSLMIFTGCMKSFLDSLLDEWYLQCRSAKAKGDAGTKARSINKNLLQKLAAVYKSPEYNGVPFEKLLKDNAPGWSDLHNKGATTVEIQTLKETIKKIRSECEAEYQA